MLKDGSSSAESDMHERELRENRVEADRLIESTDSALAQDGDLLDDAERRTIDAAEAALKKTASGTDAAAIKKALDELTRVTGDFAARRMDRSIRQALAGQSLSISRFKNTNYQEINHAFCNDSSERKTLPAGRQN